MVTNVSEDEHGIEFGDISSYNNPDPANADNPGGIPFHSSSRSYRPRRAQ